MAQRTRRSFYEEPSQYSTLELLFLQEPLKVLLHLNADPLEFRPSFILQWSTTPPGKQVAGKQVVTTGRALGTHFGCLSHTLSKSQEHGHNSTCWTRSDQEFWRHTECREPRLPFQA